MIRGYEVGIILFPFTAAIPLPQRNKIILIADPQVQKQRGDTHGRYSWWKKFQTTTWDVWNLVNTKIKLPTSTDSPDFFHQHYLRPLIATVYERKFPFISVKTWGIPWVYGFDGQGSTCNLAQQHEYIGWLIGKPININCGFDISMLGTTQKGFLATEGGWWGFSWRGWRCWPNINLSLVCDTMWHLYAQRRNRYDTQTQTSKEEAITTGWQNLHMFES